MATLCITAMSLAQDAIGSHVSRTTGFSEQMEDCGNVSYISSGNSCCNGTLTKGLSHLVSDCCGSVAYNVLNEICCNNSIFIPSSAQMQCCGKELFLPTTHMCCETKVILQKKNHVCCGTETYDQTTHICCTESNETQIKPKDQSCPKNEEDDVNNTSPISIPPEVSEFICGSESYDPKIEICCSGKLHKRSALKKCCGEHAYTPLDDHVLCCNGTLHHNVPQKSECVGGIVYAPSNTTCHLSTRPRLGEHCCGRQTYNPKTHICCNGHRHHRTKCSSCCGSEVYDHNNASMKCCSGHLYNLGRLGGECCGNLLLENNSKKTCCSSSNHAILYDNRTNHRCCGHYYYNTSLWSCCAEHLQPTPNHKSAHVENRLQPLMDLIPGICKKNVLFGKVESLALNMTHRLIDLKVVIVDKNPWLQVSMDHCSTPALENGMTYLWEKTNHGYKPLSISVDPVSDIHMFYAVCHHDKCQKGG
ncbi:galaxin [Pseudorasbora parva]|uniref:galaxin n=1 Tax=Pseudorasbora parva TaxID=51549 RepID=UPI00351E8F21